jgi:phospholipid/cholesterol/gamma-HCH transport system substrate-binding protein
MTPNRERALVGLFVLIAAAVLSVTTIAVWGGMGRSGVSHRLYLKFSGGVQPGTPVRYGGLRVGTVRNAIIDPDDSTRIQVDIVVDPETPIKTDSVARLSTLGLLSDYYIEISTGTPQAGRAPPGSVLRSVETTGLANIGDTLDSLVPQIHAALDKLTANLDGLQTTITRANDVLNDANRANLGQALARTNDLLNDRNRSNIAESISNINQLLAETRPKISTGLDNINNAAEHLTPLLEDVRKTAARADQTLANFDSLLTEDRPDLKASMAELREVLETSKATVDQLRIILNQNTVSIYDILENLRASTSNIRSLTETVKRSPASLIRGVRVEDRKPGGPSK